MSRRCLRSQSPKTMNAMLNTKISVGAKIVLASANSATLLARDRARKRDVLPPIPIPVPSKLKEVRDRASHMRRTWLRQQWPKLDKITTSKMHTTFKNYLCLDALQSGYHKSFTQIFNLINYQQMLRLRAGPESSMWNKITLDNEPGKLMVMESYLTQGEEAMLHGKYIEVYSCYFELAKYFQLTGDGDKWLSDYFFDMALDTTKHMTHDDGRLAAEANCNVGLALKESMQYFEAAKYFERFHALSKGKPQWTMDDGKTLHTEACNQLSLVYTIIANKFEASGERENYRYYLQMAYDSANEGGDIRLKGLASYVLAIAFERNRDYEEAIRYLSVYRDTCQLTGDLSSLSVAYQCMATSFHSLGKVQESVNHLHLAVTVAEEGKDERELSKACSSLGAMYNNLGDYTKAVDYFTKAYNLSRALNHEATIILARVFYGLTTGHVMLEAYRHHIASIGDKAASQRLFDWKDCRDEALLSPDKVVSCYEAEVVSSSAARSQVAAITSRLNMEDEVTTTETESDDEPNTLNAFGHAAPISRARVEMAYKKRKEKAVTISENVEIAELPPSSASESEYSTEVEGEGGN